MRSACRPFPPSKRREGGAGIEEVFHFADDLGLKGITVYRSGTRADQILTLGAGEDPMTREAFAKCDPGACRL